MALGVLTVGCARPKAGSEGEPVQHPPPRVATSEAPQPPTCVAVETIVSGFSLLAAVEQRGALIASVGEPPAKKKRRRRLSRRQAAVVLGPGSPGGEVTSPLSHNPNYAQLYGAPPPTSDD